MSNASRDDATQDVSENETDELNDVEEGLREDDLDIQSASENEATASNSYGALLQSLQVAKDNTEPARKKRRIENGNHEKNYTSASQVTDGNAAKADRLQVPGPEEPLDELQEEVDAEVDHGEGSALDVDSEDDEQLLKDPFEKHYMTVAEQDLKDAVSQVEGKQWKSLSSTVDPETRRTVLYRNDTPPTTNEAKSPRDLFLKRRLVDSGTKLMSSLTSLEKSVAGSVFNYVDVLNGSRNLKNASQLRDLSCLHALNHVFKTRDRVLKNSTKLNAQADGDALDLRDQGFTRPKVLLIVPTKQACVRFVDSIVKLSEPEQQENKARFLETFSHEDDEEWKEKPEDFRELFGGNHEEDFRIGLKFTRKTIKYFSGFYNSDIIIGSPLGLMRTITTGGGGSKDKKKSYDADFLSSIEIVIVDHANALQMQNWQHVDYVFSQLNHLPKDSHGCDFSRVRHWYLDGQAKYLRQTIILSDYLTPEINALASGQLHNIAGRVKFQPTYTGAILAISSLPLPLPVTQTFLRIPSPNPQGDADARFKFFTTTILPALVRDARHQRGTLLFVPTYADFVRVRNYLSTSADATSLSFGVVSEYTPVRDVMRARAHFLSGRHALLLYSERAHHHFRYRVKGVRRVLFYGVPDNPIFWTEIVALLGLAAPHDNESAAKPKAQGGKPVVKALFSKWDALKLERVVGTERVGRLLHDRAGDTFDFV